MDGKTQQQKVAERAGQALEQLQQATLQAALAAAEAGEVPTFADALAVANADENDSQEKGPKNGEKRRPVGNGGVPTPPGRPKGVRNRLTNIRDAVLEAFDTVGGAEYLVRLANGTQSDRAAFTGLVAKVLPTQIQANVEGGIKLELSWLGGRSIGTTQAQIPEARTQVLDLEQDSTGGYRIKDPNVPPAGGDAAAGQAPEGPAGAQGQGT